MSNGQERSTPQRAKANRVPNERLKAQRLKKNWTQVYVATRIGTSSVEVSRWETGVTEPTLYFRDKLCTLFGTMPEALGYHLLPPGMGRDDCQTRETALGRTALGSRGIAPSHRQSTWSPSPTF